MLIYILQIEGKIQDTSFVSLRALCDHFQLSYTSASKGRLKWIEPTGKVYEIVQVKVVKIKGRGRKDI